MSQEYYSYGYVIARRPYRDRSYLLDILTTDAGRITCVAKVAKKHGKIVEGSLEPFRYLYVTWKGRGNVQTLLNIEEKGKHRIPAERLLSGLYLNELLLRFTHAHHALPELFHAYKQTLHQLTQASVDSWIIMRFELALLSSLGLPLSEMRQDSNGNEIDGDQVYSLFPDIGELQSGQNSQAVVIPGSVLKALQDSSFWQTNTLLELRSVLDVLFRYLLQGKPLNSRKLIKFKDIYSEK